MRNASKVPVKSRAHADQPAQFVRHGETIRLGVPIPVADASDTLRQFQSGFAPDQCVQDVVGAEHVADVMAQNRGIDRFRDEIGGAVLVGLGDGVHIVRR